MGCNCKNKNKQEYMDKTNLGSYTYTELENVVKLMMKSRLTKEESDIVWELYNRIYHYDKMVNRRNPNHAGKVGRNLTKLYEYERKEKTDGKTERVVKQEETDGGTTTRVKKTRSKKNT